MYRLKYNKVIFLVNISLHEYSSSFVFTQNLKNTLETTKWAFERGGCGHILGLFYADNPRLCLYSTGLI